MRLQLALNVNDLDTAVDFYTKMFGTPPAKTRPGYANFAIADPPLKLVLFEVGSDEAAAADAEIGRPSDRPFEHLNHLGVEAETAEEVESADRRLADAGLTTTGVDETTCCYAAKTETWLTSPEGARWEWYVKTGDTESIEYASVGSSSSCCAS